MTCKIFVTFNASLLNKIMNFSFFLLIGLSKIYLLIPMFLLIKLSAKCINVNIMNITGIAYVLGKYELQKQVKKFLF